MYPFPSSPTRTGQLSEWQFGLNLVVWVVEETHKKVTDVWKKIPLYTIYTPAFVDHLCDVFFFFGENLFQLMSAGPSSSDLDFCF